MFFYCLVYMLWREILMSHISLGRALAMATPKTRYQSMRRFFYCLVYMLWREILMSHISLGRALAMATPKTRYQSMRRGFSSSRK